VDLLSFWLSWLARSGSLLSAAALVDDDAAMRGEKLSRSSQ
jgi:hypothetical protein